MKHLPKTRRKEALRDMADRYALRRVKDDASTSDYGPLTDGFNAGYRQAMSDARAMFCDPGVTYTFYEIQRWSGPLK